MIRETPKWAQWSVTLGIMIPLLCFLGRSPADPSKSFMENLTTQVVTFSFLDGPNPLGCFVEHVSIKVDNKLGQPRAGRYECQVPTRIPWSGVVLLSTILLIAGAYGYVRGEVSNRYPVDWQPFDKNVIKNPNRNFPEDQG